MRHLVPTLVILLALGATVASAQPLVESFTKEDCSFDDNFCTDANCDQVREPGRHFDERVAWPESRFQWVLQIENDEVPKSGLVLSDLLPDCMRIDCASECVDTDCNETPDSDPVWISFSGGGTAGEPICDEATNTIEVPDIHLGPGESMEVRFCGAFTAEEGDCCNQATLNDPETGVFQLSEDQATMQDGDTCTNIGPIKGNYEGNKSDCGPFTLDPVTGEREPVDCDDVYVDDDRERYVNLPSAGKRVKWAMKIQNPPLFSSMVKIQDWVGMDQQVLCDPQMDPFGEGWGCFEVYIDEELQPLGSGDECFPGPAGGIVVERPLDPLAWIEVRFCARITSAATHLVCNSDAHILLGGEDGYPMRFYYADGMDSDRDICIRAEPPRVEARKTVVDLDGPPTRPGDTVEYRIELCETSGDGPVLVELNDVIPEGIVNARLERAPFGCEIGVDLYGVLGLECYPPFELPAGGTPCLDPVSIVWRGEVACDGLEDGDTICNRAEVIMHEPENFHPITTDDPGDPRSDRDYTCIEVGLDDLEATKMVTLARDANDNGIADCERDLLAVTIEIESTGSVEARQVVLEDVLPAGMVHVAGSTRIDGQPGPDPAGTPPILTIDLGDLPVGATRTVSFDATIADVADGTVLSNQAILSSEDGRLCGYQVPSDDPATPLAGDPTETPVRCVPPAAELGQASKSLLDPADPGGAVVTEAEPGDDLLYRIEWCSTGDLAATDVVLRDELPPCGEYVGPTRLDGNVVTPDPLVPGPPEVVEVEADASQEPAECHEVEIPVRVAVDAELCGDGTVVENLGRVTSAEGISADTDEGVPASFVISVPLELRRNAEVASLDPLDPPKGPANWGTVMERVGSCDPVRPRLGPEDAVDPPWTPYVECLAGDGVFGSGPLILYELAGACDGRLTLRRRDCNGDEAPDIEVSWRF